MDSELNPILCETETDTNVNAILTYTEDNAMDQKLFKHSNTHFIPDFF